MENKTGLEKFIDKAKGALEDMRKYGEGKKQTDWGRGCEATFEKCILNAEQLLAAERAQKQDEEQLLDVPDGNKGGKV